MGILMPAPGGYEGPNLLTRDFTAGHYMRPRLPRQTGWGCQYQPDKTKKLIHAAGSRSFTAACEPDMSIAHAVVLKTSW